MADQLQFCNQSRPLGEITKSTNLPAILMYDVSQEIDPQLVSSRFDAREILLLHSTFEFQRVRGRGAIYNSSTRSFEDTQVDVTVDRSYPGWFAVFGDPAEHHDDPVVPHYRKVGQLATSGCNKFLVSGSHPMDAMKIVRMPNGSKGLEACKISSGTVMTNSGMYTVTSRIQIRKNLLQKKSIKREETYMSCHDELNNEVLISCNAHGIFYVLSHYSKPVKTQILKMDDIVNRFKFPLLVKMVHGHTAQMPSTCKGTLVLMKSENPEICLASTLFTPQPAYFHIEADASLRFFTAVNYQDFRRNKVCSQNFQNCYDNEPLIYQNIRFCSDDQGLASARSSATSGTGSEVVDADDKFDWGKVNFLSNTPFLESVDTSQENITLYTHHMEKTPPPKLQAQQRSQDKDKDGKVKVKTKTITRTKMYDMPKLLRQDTIEIKMKNQGSVDSYDESVLNSPPPSECTGSLSSTNSSPAASSFGQSPPDEFYSQIWNEEEQLEAVLEGVTLRSISPEKASLEPVTGDGSSDRNDSDGYLVPLPAHNVGGCERVYVNGWVRNAHGRGSYGYTKVDDGSVGDDPIATTGSSKNSVEYKASYEPISEITSSRTQLPQTSSGEPNNGYTETDEDHYELVSETQTENHYERPGSLFSKMSAYKHVPSTLEHGQGIYMRSNSRDLDQDMPNRYNTASLASYVEASSLDDLFPSAHYNDPITTDSPKPFFSKDRGSYASISSFAAGSIPRSVDKSKANSATEAVYMNMNDLAISNSAKPLYVNSDIDTTSSTTANGNSNSNNSILDEFRSDLGQLKLKPETQVALKGIDLQTFESSLGDSDIRTRLEELSPNMNKIDLSKVSCTLTRHLKKT